MTSSNGLSPSAVESVAGFTAGIVSTLAVHPLDIIKTRLQIDSSNQSRFGASIQIARDIFRDEGPTGVRALYRGLTPNLVGNSLGWALYFLWYRQAQDVLQRIHGRKTLSSLDYLGASAASGILSALLTNPIWVIKTRMLSTSATHAGAYPSLVSGLRTVWREEGLRGYFRGLVPTLAGVSHGAIYFTIYEKLKAERARQRSQDGHEHAALSNADFLVVSGISKVFAGSLTYPHQVVRARLQTYASSASGSQGVLKCISHIWHREGFRGFYKGLGPNLIRVVPSTCVTFIVYENARKALPKLPL